MKFLLFVILIIIFNNINEKSFVKNNNEPKANFSNIVLFSNHKNDSIAISFYIKKNSNATSNQIRKFKRELILNKTN